MLIVSMPSISSLRAVHFKTVAGSDVMVATAPQGTSVVLDAFLANRFVHVLGLNVFCWTTQLSIEQSNPRHGVALACLLGNSCLIVKTCIFNGGKERRINVSRFGTHVPVIKASSGAKVAFGRGEVRIHGNPRARSNAASQLQALLTKLVEEGTIPAEAALAKSASSESSGAQHDRGKHEGFTAAEAELLTTPWH